jgi:hypothetical protein
MEEARELGRVAFLRFSEVGWEAVSEEHGQQ